MLDMRGTKDGKAKVICTNIIYACTDMTDASISRTPIPTHYFVLIRLI